MLEYLYIENIILIEREKIFFQKGFNILTGETGSGKSALLKALQLIYGDKADLSLIRRGAEKGIVEALFNIEKSDKELQVLLDECGISVEEKELVIRREISQNGKNRIYINHQVTQLSILKKIAAFLFQIVSQHASYDLLSIDYHREMVDSFGCLLPLRKEYENAYCLLQRTVKRQEELKNTNAERLRLISRYEAEIEELEEASIKEGEEEELFNLYTALTNSEEISNGLTEASEILSGENHSIILMIKKEIQILEPLSKYDPKFKECLEIFKNHLIELREVGHSFTHSLSRIEIDPTRLIEINERLALINRLKKKYGSSFESIQEYLKKARNDLQTLQNVETEEEDLEKLKENQEASVEKLASQLTTKRTESALCFEKKLTEEVKTLNMIQAKIRVDVREQKRSQTGDQRIEILLTPNLGEIEISLSEHASGGEISRLLLAINRLLIAKLPPALLVFDEIDANIGGETASVIGTKLTEIGQEAQVIAITHFPQVASKASHHLKIFKVESKERTLSKIAILSTEEEITHEMKRMIGSGLHPFAQQK